MKIYDIFPVVDAGDDGDALSSARRCCRLMFCVAKRYEIVRFYDRHCCLASREGKEAPTCPGDNDTTKASNRRRPRK